MTWYRNISSGLVGYKGKALVALSYSYQYPVPQMATLKWCAEKYKLDKGECLDILSISYMESTCICMCIDVCLCIYICVYRESFCIYYWTLSICISSYTCIHTHKYNYTCLNYMFAYVKYEAFSGTVQYIQLGLFLSVCDPSCCLGAWHTRRPEPHVQLLPSRHWIGWQLRRWSTLAVLAPRVRYPR